MKEITGKIVRYTTDEAIKYVELIVDWEYDEKVKKFMLGWIDYVDVHICEKCCVALAHSTYFDTDTVAVRDIPIEEIGADNNDQQVYALLNVFSRFLEFKEDYKIKK